MNVAQPQLYCPNPECDAPLNSIGNRVCDHCQTPLVYRYLWAVGEAVLTIPVNNLVAGRYFVKSPQIWLDTQPSLQPDFPDAELPDDIQAYLHLYPHRLQLPEVFGVCPIAPQADGATASTIMLLENVPLDEKGNLYPAITQAWASASAVRQLYWLWQLLTLWQPLADRDARASLLVSDNIRVEGWRVRLCQLFWDEGILASSEPTAAAPLSLADLALLWLEWIDQAQPTITDSLRHLCYEMRADDADVTTIATQLNQILLQQSAQLPLHLQVASQTDTGPQHSHNEDSCYPPPDRPDRPDPLLPQLAIVCDGIGGHEGGEIASQLAVQSLKLQVQALIADLAEQSEPLTPTVIAEQLAAAVRVINDLIAAQNDEQGREDRRRMGTTLVMALQLPQQVPINKSTIAENSHELYLLNVGDSRAYWITPRYCHRLTLDDDVAVREVRMGRMLYREALQRPDSGSLIQALGTRTSEFLYPTVQRLILEEDGVLLLCSDGLSDNGWVEASWSTIMLDVFRGKRSLDSAATAWTKLANEKNGHDNVTVVLLRCRVSSPAPDVVLPPTDSEPSDWSDASRALLQTESVSETAPPKTASYPRRSWLWLTLTTGLLLLGGLAFWYWEQFNPATQQRPEPSRQEKMQP